ncbi:MAG: hypothetical protein ACLPKB_10445, partial [Xanthobacteraceae bacterium]
MTEFVRKGHASSTVLGAREPINRFSNSDMRWIEFGVSLSVTHLRIWADEQGNESRLTGKRIEDLKQIFRVPRGALSPSFDGSFVDGLADQV